MQPTHETEAWASELWFDLVDHGEHATLRLRGVLDAMTVPEFRPTMDRIASGPWIEIEVDVSGLDLIDSSGVAVIVSLFKRLRARGGQLGVSGLTKQPRRIFELLHLDRVLQW